MFENLSILFFLTLLCVVIARVDAYYFGTYATPSILLLAPFTAVVGAHLLVADILGFAELHAGLIGVWTIGTIVFWATGHALRYLIVGAGSLPGRVDVSATKQTLITFWSVAGGLVSILLLVHAYRVLQTLGGLNALASPSFLEEWGFGWPAHVRVLVMVILIMVIGSTRRWTPLIVGGVALMFSVILLYQSKGALLAPLIAGGLYRIVTGVYVPKIRDFALAIAGSFILFQLIYLVGWASLDPESLLKSDVYIFFSLHFMSYLFAGILGFSESLRHGTTWLNADGLVLFAPMWNIVAAAFDRPLILVAELAQDHYVEIARHGVGSNVNTLFGTIWLVVGPIYGLCVVVILALACHCMLLVIKLLSNRWLVVAYSYWGGLLVFGWFEYYFWLLVSLEIPVICVCLAIAEFCLHPARERAPLS